MDSSFTELGMRWLSSVSSTSSQMPLSSSSTFWRYDAMASACVSSPLPLSFCSMLDRMRHEARRAPITFLYPTDSRLRSSTLSSASLLIADTVFIAFWAG